MRNDRNERLERQTRASLCSLHRKASKSDAIRSCGRHPLRKTMPAGFPHKKRPNFDFDSKRSRAVRLVCSGEIKSERVTNLRGITRAFRLQLTSLGPSDSKRAGRRFKSARLLSPFSFVSFRSCLLLWSVGSNSRTATAARTRDLFECWDS